MGKRSKRQNKDPLELKNMAKTLESFGLKSHISDGQKSSGPVVASSVRKHGDEVMSEVLAQALAASETVERGTHPFHTYPARMHPDSARLILPHTTGPVHDPFCGGGTVLIEAKMAGRKAYGSDISPIAHLVAQARLADPALAAPMRAAARKIADKAKLRIDVEVPEVCVPWYEHHVSQELGRIRDGIAEQPVEIRSLLNAVFSSIVIKTSFRKSDTANKMEKHHRPPQSTAVLFHKRAREFARMLETMPAEPKSTLIHGDARSVVPPEKVGLVLTSPPYPGVYDYLPMHQLRYAWLGIEPEESLAREIGSRRDFRSKGRTDALKTWLDDTDKWIKNQAGILAPGAAMIIVVGDGLVAGKLVDALFPTTEAMKKAGLEIFARASADRPDHARNAIRIEHMVMAVKPTT